MRTLNAEIAALIALAVPPSINELLRITVDGVTLRYAQHEETIAGNLYGAYLRVAAYPRYIRSLGRPTARVRLSVADLAVPDAILAHRDTLQGAPAVLARWYPEALAEDLLITGTIGRVTCGRDGAEFEIAALELDTVQVPVRVCQQECSHVFKSTECGYVGATASCNKTWANCSDASRLRIQSFDGVLTISRDLTATVEGPSNRLPPPGAAAGQRGGAQHKYLEP